MTVILIVLAYWGLCAGGILAIRWGRRAFSKRSNTHKPAWYGVLFAPIVFPSLLMVAPYLISQNWESIEPRLLEFITNLAKE